MKKMKYLYRTEKAIFAILPLSQGGWVLRIDDQYRSFSFTAECVAEDCANGHVSAIVPAGNVLKDINTKGMSIPSNLDDWEHYEMEPLEVFA